MWPASCAGGNLVIEGNKIDGYVCCLVALVLDSFFVRGVDFFCVEYLLDFVQLVRDLVRVVQAIVDDARHIFNDLVVSFVEVLVQCLHLLHDVFDASRQRFDRLIELSLQLFGAHGEMNVGLHVAHAIAVLHLNLVFHLV